jgi:hypothetical protein
MRKLEISLAALGDSATLMGNTNTLATTHNWSSTVLEAAFQEVKDSLRPE